ncbi:DUF349 domain-containing protein [Urbifossiella limnaea]|nr:DUF349 domain-containing protein [Urbifossiella limnaea]
MTLTDFEVEVLPTPRYVWPSGPSGGWVVFERPYTSGGHPGSTELRLTRLDARGGVQARGWFTTGWRRYLESARLETVAGIPDPVVVVRTAEDGGGEPERQWYAKVDDRYDLVRLEQEDGAAVGNGYWLNHGRCGPPPPHQSADDWEADLTSTDRARVLRALVWLGGHHLLPLQPGQQQRNDMEDARDAELARAVRARTGVVARLRELAASGEAWEREGARLALSPKDVRWF